jgi:hypothetical protein
MENLMAFDITNYVTAAERVAMFYEKFPEGSIQFEYMGVMDGDPTKMWGVARAYRSPDDALPGVGTASEFIIGKTPYTFGSELQNLETSCWSRAVASLSIGTSKGISSKEEVATSRQNQAPGPAKQKELQVVQEPPSDIPEADPWFSIPAMDESVDAFNEPQVPLCLHGEMSRRSGISKKTGKPYAGYFCDNEPQCDPKFDRS